MRCKHIGEMNTMSYSLSADLRRGYSTHQNIGGKIGGPDTISIWPLPRKYYMTASKSINNIILYAVINYLTNSIAV